MFPNLIALDTDGTIFTGKLDERVWGKGPNAVSKLADNIQQVNESTLQDQSNHDNKIHLGPDIPRIVTDILQNGASLAIVSRNTSKALCDRALYYFKAKDPKTGETKSIISMVRYDEIVDEPTTEHFKRIHGWSKFDYPNMIMFGDLTANKPLQSDLGVFVRDCSESKTGLTWEIYSAAIEAWRCSKIPKPIGSTTLGIAHFNDVYQVTDQKVTVNNQAETINVMKFATSLSDIMSKWKDQGLTIFSGDLFSPSTESSITRGRHMPAIINGLKVDVSVVGNHEFDFGYPRLKQLINQTAFPWLLSNIIDTKTKRVPEPMKDVHVLNRGGVQIGFIGLVEREWIATITGWPENFEYQDMAKVGKALSATLRDPSGPYKCDFVIALTHCRIPNDIKLARDLGALSPSGQSCRNIAAEHGVDLLLGGHDHVYWISKGVAAWEGYDLNSEQPDAKDDNGDVLVVKSGTDYQDISEVVLTLKDTPPGSVRKKVIQEIRGKRCVTRGNLKEDVEIKEIYDEELAVVKGALEEKLCTTEVQLDTQSSIIRLQESAVGNWIADCLRNAYDEALKKLGYANGTDGVIICNGDIRGDRSYDPGPIYLRDLMTMLPYPDPLVVVELSAKALWDTLESGLSRHPTQEGRFPAVSGLRVEWDSSQPAGKRVRSISLLSESQKLDANGNPTLENIDPNSTSRKYLIMVGEYMTQGGDGYDILKTQKQILTAENGQSKSALVRKYLLGTQMLNQKIQDKPQPKTARLSSFMSTLPSAIPSPFSSSPISALSSFTAQSVRSIRGSVEEQLQGLQQIEQIQQLSQRALDKVTPSVKWLASQQLVSAALQLAEFEDVGLMDAYERQRLRMEAQTHRAQTGSASVRSSLPKLPKLMRFASTGSSTPNLDANQMDAMVTAADEKAAKALPTIHPVVDGRLKDVHTSVAKH